jgi:hypothetical protein
MPTANASTTSSCQLSECCDFLLLVVGLKVEFCLFIIPPVKSLTNPADTMNDDAFLQLMAKYKFTLAFENALGEDYITEKLWRPLKLGSVPIYLGSPSVKV